jgi:hypothetical protein
MTTDPDIGVLSGLLPDGQQWTVQPLLWGCYQLSIGPVGAGFYDRSWHYAGHDAVYKALAQWLEVYDDVIEPTGWHRAHDGTGRRRRDGDPTQEYIHW